VRTTLFTVVNILNNVGRTTLFNPQYCWQLWTMWAAWHIVQSC
jgi:hypothetical protein